jgi:outer membrane biogenesis lipoprotein LolB
MNGQTAYEQEGRTAYEALQKAGLDRFDWTFEQVPTVVLRLNFSAKNPRLR